MINSNSNNSSNGKKPSNNRVKVLSVILAIVIVGVILSFVLIK